MWLISCRRAWRRVTTMEWQYGATPARPFDSAQGERPFPGMDSRLGASSTGSGAGMTENNTLTLALSHRGRGDRTPSRACFDPPRADFQRASSAGGSSTSRAAQAPPTRVVQRYRRGRGRGRGMDSGSGAGMTGRNTLTLTLSHRGRGDRTNPPPPGIRVMQGSHQGRGEGMDSRLGATTTPIEGEGEGWIPALGR